MTELVAYGVSFIVAEFRFLLNLLQCLTIILVAVKLLTFGHDDYDEIFYVVKLRFVLET